MRKFTPGVGMSLAIALVGLAGLVGSYMASAAND